MDRKTIEKQKRKTEKRKTIEKHRREKKKGREKSTYDKRFVSLDSRSLDKPSMRNRHSSRNMSDSPAISAHSVASASATFADSYRAPTHIIAYNRIDSPLYALFIGNRAFLF